MVGVQFENQYIEISTQMSNNPNVYGLGERVHNYRLDPNFQTYTMWNRGTSSVFLCLFPVCAHL